MMDNEKYTRMLGKDPRGVDLNILDRQAQEIVVLSAMIGELKTDRDTIAQQTWEKMRDGCSGRVLSKKVLGLWNCMDTGKPCTFHQCPAMGE